MFGSAHAHGGEQGPQHPALVSLTVCLPMSSGVGWGWGIKKMLCVGLQPQDSRQAHPYGHTVSAELFTYKYTEIYENKTHISKNMPPFFMHSYVCWL